MKSIISITLLFAAFTLHSCNTQTQKPLNGQTYYLLFFSNTLASEQELHFLSPNEVTIKLTSVGDINGLVDLRENSSTKVYKYWLNDSVIEIPEYNKGLKIYLRKKIISFGYSTGIPPFDKGILYKTSVLDHLSDDELRLRIKNVTASEDDVPYFLRMLEVHKREVVQDAEVKELPIEQEKVTQPNDVLDEDQQEEQTSKSFTHTFQDRTIVTPRQYRYSSATFYENGMPALIPWHPGWRWKPVATFRSTKHKCG